jgi:hypothetical protein
VLAPGYVRTFGGRLVERAGYDGDFGSLFERSSDDAVTLLIEKAGLASSVADHAASLRAQGVRRQVLQGGDPALYGRDLNAEVAAWAAAAPDVIEAWAGVSMQGSRHALAELERAETLGMRGVCVVPFLDRVDSESEEFHELYGAVAELGWPVWIHVGMNYSPSSAMGYSTWQGIDRIAGRHPSLRIVVGHSGWPWILEGCAVLMRHRNVYADLSGHRAKYLSAPGSGWEPLLNYGNTLLRHKVIFGSVTWLHGVPVSTLAEEVRGLPISARTAQAWLHDNAVQVFGS